MLSNFGFSLVEDPGGQGLLRQSKAENVESQSRVVINPGYGCIAVIDGEMYKYTKNGRFPVHTGLSPYFKGIQNIVSKGKSTHTSNFYYYDTNPNVYRDIQFYVPNLLCREKETGLQGMCTPRINVSVRIAVPDQFFYVIKGFDLRNDAVGKFVENQVVPATRKELFDLTQNNPLIHVNANACNFSNGLENRIKGMLADFGLDTKAVHVLDLGVSTELANDMKEYHSRNAKASQEAAIIKKYADELFDGNVQKATQYLLMSKGIDKDMQGFNPFAWEMMKSIMGNNRP